MINYIILVTLTALLSIYATIYTPIIIAYYRRFKTAKNEKLERMIADEIQKQLKEILSDD